jgi:hypothetical protein
VHDRCRLESPVEVMHELGVDLGMHRSRSDRNTRTRRRLVDRILT